MKKILTWVLVLVFTLSLVACSSNSSQTASSSGSGEKVELTLAYPGGDEKKDDLEKFLKKFTDKYPNIKVKLIFVPNNSWADYFNKLQTMAAGGNSPDVIRVAIEGIQMFVKSGMALPLDDYMKSDPAALENYDDFHTKLQSAFVIDNKTYGFAWDWNNVVVHFNTDMLKKANLPVPDKNWTKDDFLKYAQAMTTEENGKKTYGFAIPNYYFGASAWLLNNDTNVLNADMTKSTLDDPKAIEVMQFFQDLIYKYKVAPVPNPKTDMINQLMTGQVGMIAAGKWPFGTYEKNNFKSVEVQFVPKFTTQKVIYGDGSFPVLKSTKHPKESYLLSAFLSNPDSQRTMLSADSIPARKSVMNEVLPKSPIKNWSVYSESADIAVAVQAPAEYAGIEAIFNRHMSDILSNQSDAATAMKKAAQEINDLLAQKK
ncbi:ABC transporter substrate-binding protein [Paenibacillus aestuarii]|uniref:Sugar ABC transporter substrate-binding protein n=1 Tax=Paenibacillus aestuarii TaxID=516965 RepID=A0ABW0K2V1_9BACL|nr:sugar ABC transporter substrate-binding protein [Paenibacillus aestuarii]